ncbi:hypothetical protein LZG75_03480 [Polynucleobacter sp. IMCC30063]|uniref:LIC12192 family sporadic carbohydrate cluster protein n=1 Tax=Polynucleobacter sp. IMCC30063 TaxID=2907298 RepID=UPI001F3BC0F9|nr:LIC12192 family sporadic carbohydrate cluster protein [Polynucleobacter sp. IMCC30063]MCE7505292.1 hypothetical protein [Polynucleobacter sp. IMCC30063]
MKKLRGYISSREWNGSRAPQHIQNIVLRDYCKNKNYEYLLSATEYAMENCFLILNELINNLSDIDGIVAYSLFQMPADNYYRSSVFQSFLSKGKEIHFACERLSITKQDEVARIEKIILVEKVLPRCLDGLNYHG